MAAGGAWKSLIFVRLEESLFTQHQGCTRKSLIRVRLEEALFSLKIHR